MTDVSIPLGLLSLAAVLEQEGVEVALIDWNHEARAGRLPLDESLYETAAARIDDESPDIVGFTTMCNSFHITLRMAEAWKRRRGDIPVILGGPQASVVDVAALEAFPFLDYILRGEAEVTLPRFLREWSAGTREYVTPGLTYRWGGRIARNPEADLLPDLDTLRMAAYHLLPYSPAESGAIDAGRGCPFECTFCSTSRYWRRRFRLKSIDRILTEMRALRDQYGATHFSFQHDLFTLNGKRILEFCQRLCAERWNVEWACSARVDCVTPELLGRMAEAGCKAVFFGVETGSCRMQQEIRKRLKLDQVWTALDAALCAGMTPTVSFISGFPTETEDDLRQTFEMIERLLQREKVHVQGHLLGPEPGTADYERWRGRLRFDGYFSDIAGTAYRLLEPEWFQAHPELFSSFHYYEPLTIPRGLLRGLDLFVHGPCAILRKTVCRLAARRGGLWPLYREWKGWSEAHGAGRGPAAGQSVDEFLMDFYAFIDATAGDGEEAGEARDEILSFYLRHYNDVPVRYLNAEQEAALSVAGRVG